MSQPQGPVVLAVEAVEAGYEPGLSIVRGASLTVSEGEIVAILGPNGAGKSTLMKAVAGLVPVTGGRILFDGTDVAGHPAHGLIHRGLAFVPQTENIFAGMTIAENLELCSALLGRGRARPLDGIYALFPDLARDTRLKAGRLSGGQRQMLAMARALIASPRLLMLDEPSAGLSPKLVGMAFAKLQEIRAAGVTILMVEQNVKAALALADRAVVLVEGRERLQGEAAALRDDARLSALYLGGGHA